MTEPYLVAMQHAEFHSQNVLRRHFKNRPLGHLEDHYRYKPPQPVLSCRTVSIDLTGTRTYRAKSAADIIHEQQRLIHDIYKRARTTSSAPSRRIIPSHPDTAQLNTLNSLSINGSQTCSSQSSWPSTRTQSATLRTRPNTVHGSARNKKIPRPQTTPHVTLFQQDPDWMEASKVYQDTHRQVREQWSVEKHSLDEGQFVRGKKDSQLMSLDPKTGSQWLVFGGGQDIATSGVVDAFTAMKSTEDLYNIDGATGSHVAKQLHKGDRIRVGVNGSVATYETKLRQWTSEQDKKLVEAEEGMRGRGYGTVPLCWGDQLRQDTIKVLSPRSGSVQGAYKPSSETRPVIVNESSIHRQNSSESILKKAGRLHDGYKVKVRSKGQGQGGQEGQGYRVIANISIGKDDSEFEKEIENLKYDDILQMKVMGNRQRKGEETHQLPEKSAQNVAFGSVSDKNTLHNASFVERAVIECVGQERSCTAHSMLSNQCGLDAEEIVVGHAPGYLAGQAGSRSAHSSSTTRPAGSARPLGTRPDPPRITSANRGVRSGIRLGSATPGTGNITGETEYIQISQGLIVTQTPVIEPPPAPPTPGPSTDAALESISSHNMPSDNLDEDIPEIALPDLPNNVTERASLVTPPPSPSPSLSQKFAFDIPTGDLVESESGDLEKGLSQSMRSVNNER